MRILLENIIRSLSIDYGRMLVLSCLACAKSKNDAYLEGKRSKESDRDFLRSVRTMYQSRLS